MVKPTTCHITVEVTVGGKLVETREWPAVDVMKTSHVRAWATRQFNLHWMWRKPDVIIHVNWTLRHGPKQGHTILRGSLSGVNNLRHKRGYFED